MKDIDLKIKQENIYQDDKYTKEKSQIQKDLEITSDIESHINDQIDKEKNNQIEKIWKSFLEDNPEIMSKLSKFDKLPENASAAGSFLLANGMTEEARLWKDYRRNKVKEGD